LASAFTQAELPNPTTSLAFLGPPVTVTLAAGQKVFVSATKAFGSKAAAGAKDLRLYICYKGASPGAITSIGSGMWGLSVVANQRLPFSLSADFAPGVGTFQVGLCGYSLNAADWNDNEWAYVTALVHT
jgi:hypothetical protein